MNTNDASLAAALRRIRGGTIDEAAIRGHVMRPQHLLGAASDQGSKDAPSIRNLAPPPDQTLELNIQGFIGAVQAALTNLCAGYSLRLRQNGLITLATLNWNWAKAPQDGSESWTPETRAHVASLSKIPTAIAMTRLLLDKDMSYDTPIIDWLPEYWDKGPGVNAITFRQLLDHTSGLAYQSTSPRSDYPYMKSQIEAGTHDLDRYSYQNMNYGLCRILIATIDGTISPDSFFTDSTTSDLTWDLTTISAYQAYVHANVFAPSDVTGPTLDHDPDDALAYNFPVSGNGWNSQDQSTMAGGSGWHMTVDQLLAVMSTFRRGGTIMSPAEAQTVLDDGFGLNCTAPSALGTYYAKVGGWNDSAGHMEQGTAFFLPQNMELVLLVNSPLAVAVPGALLSYDDTGAAGNVSDPVTVGFDDWTQFPFLFCGSNLEGQERIYAVNPPGQLLSYGDNGTPGNVFGPVIVGFDDWTKFKFLFAGRNTLGQNRIYAVNPQGQLLSYADNGMPGNVADYVIVGFDDWTEFRYLFAGRNSLGQDRIYAVRPDGQLWSYADNGTPGNVAAYVVVGFGGWTDFTFLFAGANVAGQGRIYAVKPNGQLLSYGDSGTPGNVSNPQIVGFGGWTDFKCLFAGRNALGQDRIYGVWALRALPPGQSLYAAVSSAYKSNIVPLAGQPATP
jgi:CubicO group peptidase (beta-lactamase class C family)